MTRLGGHAEDNREEHRERYQAIHYSKQVEIDVEMIYVAWRDEFADYKKAQSAV